MQKVWSNRINFYPKRLEHKIYSYNITNNLGNDDESFGIWIIIIFLCFILIRRSNLLTILPRELCFLPIQVLLVSNNRLISLPDELGRMEQLTELDAACNQITHLPARMSDLRNLRSLSLRNNHLVYLPRGNWL